MESSRNRIDSLGFKIANVTIGYRSQLLLVLFRVYGLCRNYWGDIIIFQISERAAKFKDAEIYTNDDDAFVFINRKIEIMKEQKHEGRSKKSYAECLSISTTIGPLASEDGTVRLEHGANIRRSHHKGVRDLARRLHIGCIFTPFATSELPHRKRYRSDMIMFSLVCYSFSIFVCNAGIGAIDPFSISIHFYFTDIQVFIFHRSLSLGVFVK